MIVQTYKKIIVIPPELEEEILPSSQIQTKEKIEIHCVDSLCMGTQPSFAGPVI